MRNREEEEGTKGNWEKEGIRGLKNELNERGKERERGFRREWEKVGGKGDQKRDERTREGGKVRKGDERRGERERGVGGVFYQDLQRESLKKKRDSFPWVLRRMRVSEHGAAS